MKTLAIYGDSFADPIVGNQDPKIDNDAWPTILSNNLETTNYARGGTSLYYSYKRFMETHLQYDTVIFILTDHGRWYNLLSVPTLKSQWGDYLHPIPGPTMTNHWRQNSELKKHIDTNLDAKLKALDSYFGYLFNDIDDFNHIASGLMIDNIVRERPDVLVIAGGKFPIYHELVNHKTALFNFAVSWMNNWPEYQKYLGEFGFYPWKELKLRCHFSKEVNRIIANEMLVALATGSWNPNIPNKIDSEHDLSYYYKIS